MACFVGKDGVLKVGTETIGEVTNFSVEETAETIDCTAMGDVYRDFVASYKNWTASAEVHWDPADTGQIAVAVGTEVVLSLYPEGAETGDTEITGTAIVTGKTVNSTFDGIVSASITLQGKGALTTGEAV
jgi:predicted secreted protein